MKKLVLIASLALLVPLWSQHVGATALETEPVAASGEVSDVASASLGNGLHVTGSSPPVGKDGAGPITADPVRLSLPVAAPTEIKHPVAARIAAPIAQPPKQPRRIYADTRPVRAPIIMGIQF